MEYQTFFNLSLYLILFFQKPYSCTHAYEISLRFNKPGRVTIYTEYYLYNFISTLGNVGGTLGLFIGFSFSGLVTYILNQIVICGNSIKRRSHIGMNQSDWKGNVKSSEGKAVIWNTSKRFDFLDFKLVFVGCNCKEKWIKVESYVQKIEVLEIALKKLKKDIHEKWNWFIKT